MRGLLRGFVAALLLVSLSAFTAVGPAAAQTHTVASSPYSVTTTLAAGDEFDSHELRASPGKEVSYTVTATGSCIVVLLGLGHNFDFNTSLYLPRYSQETCVESFSKAYKVPSGGGPDFSIVVTTELQGDVAYKIDITIGEPSPLGLIAGIGAFAALIGVGAAISVAMRRRRRAAAPPPAYPAQSPSSYPPPYAPPMPNVPPPQRPMEPGPPPGPPTQ